MCKENDSVIFIPIVAGYYWNEDMHGNKTLYFKETREKKKLGKNGKGTGELKEFINVIGYYTSMQMLLKAVVKDSAYRKIQSGEIKNVKDYIDSLQDMTDRIETITGF